MDGPFSTGLCKVRRPTFAMKQDLLDVVPELTLKKQSESCDDSSARSDQHAGGAGNRKVKKRQKEVDKGGGVPS